MKLYRTIILLSCSIPLIACAQTNSILKGQENFIGHWKAPNSEITVDRNGTFKYTSTYQTENKTANTFEQSSSQSNISAPISQINNQKIQVGTGDFSTTFNVNKPPYQQNGAWHMTINSENYSK